MPIRSGCDDGLVRILSARRHPNRRRRGRTGAAIRAATGEMSARTPDGILTGDATHREAARGGRTPQRTGSRCGRPFVPVGSAAWPGPGERGNRERALADPLRARLDSEVPPAGQPRAGRRPRRGGPGTSGRDRRRGEPATATAHALQHPAVGGPRGDPAVLDRAGVPARRPASTSARGASPNRPSHQAQPPRAPRSLSATCRSNGGAQRIVPCRRLG